MVYDHLSIECKYLATASDFVAVQVAMTGVQCYRRGQSFLSRALCILRRVLHEQVVASCFEENILTVSCGYGPHVFCLSYRIPKTKRVPFYTTSVRRRT